MKKTHLLALSLAAFMSGTALAQKACVQGHCAAVSAKINAFCISQNLAGQDYLVIGPDSSECLCPCSCVAPDTLISTKVAPFVEDFESIQVGDVVDSPFSSKRAQPKPQCYP